MEWKVQIGEKSRQVKIPDSCPDNAAFAVEVNGKPMLAKWQRATKTLFVKDSGPETVWRSIHCRTRSFTKFTGENDTAFNLEFTPSSSPHTVCIEGAISPFYPGQDGKNATKAKKPKVIRSQMTGKVLKVLVVVGDVVSSGDTLLIVEAMKMENRVLATSTGQIDSIKVREGDNIANGAELVKFK